MATEIFLPRAGTCIYGNFDDLVEIYQARVAELFSTISSFALIERARG
jgi:hypothetical protein